MEKLAAVLTVVVLVFASWSLAAQQSVPEGRDAAKAPVRATQPSSIETVVGTIQYDPGAPQDSFRADSGAGNEIVGNRFNSASGSPLKVGTLTGVSFFPQAADGNAVISLLGPPTVGGNALVLQTVPVGTVANSVFNAVVVNQAVSADFLVGQYLGNFNGPDNLGIRNATTNGQGFHGFQVNFGAGTAVNFTALTNTNAMVRATGNILVPVELMQFSVE